MRSSDKEEDVDLRLDDSEDRGSGSFSPDRLDQPEGMRWQEGASW